MECPCNEVGMDKISTDARVLNLKTSPVKEAQASIKPHCPSAESTKVFFFDNSNAGAIHNKENNARRTPDETFDECFEDSGYLSLHNSQIHDPHVVETEHVGEKPAVLSSTVKTRKEKKVSSPVKCQGGTKSSYLVSVSTPVDKRKIVASSSTPCNQSINSYLPILKFQREVCEELEKSYKKNKRFDWSIVSKVAENHLLDRVIGRHMGLEHIDVFASLQSRNMKILLAKILCMLGDMDLISCTKVSRTWRKIIDEDATALRRFQRAEEALRESSNSLRTKASGLTRDAAVSRVVFSCMQTMASSQRSAQNSAIGRRTISPQKENANRTRASRFDEFVEAARTLKNHESLRSCLRCGSPATHSPQMQKATCRRSSCLFEFCTCCQEAFHGSTPCRTVNPCYKFSSSKVAIKPGSARSLRRL